MNTNKINLLLLAILLAFAVTACDKPYSTDSAASKLDESSEKASDNMAKTADNSDAVLHDTTITAKVKTDILAESGLKGFDISVKTTNGVVTLTGTVDTQENSDKAQKIASDVTDVKSVENNIVVKP